MNIEQIRLALFSTKPEADLVESFDRVLDSNSILKTSDCPVLDSLSQPLIEGELYQWKE